MIECGVVQHKDEQTCSRSSGGPLSLARSSVPTAFAGAIPALPLRPYALASVDESAAPYRVVWSMTFRTDAVGPRNRVVRTEVDVTAVQPAPVGPVKRLPAPRSGPDSLLPRIASPRLSARGRDHLTGRRLDVVA